ncbi:MAG TPA: virulence factor [Devosiaceae bacterium]
MMTATIIYWRDIPTQVVVGGGRRGAKRMLADRFMVAVDKAARAAGLTDEDEYLAEWHKVQLDVAEKDQSEALEEIASHIEAEFPAKRLAEIARNGGRLESK